MNKPIILASRSPRRQELLRQAGIAYEVDPADIEEVMDPALSLDQRIMALAKAKASAVLARHPDRLVVGADSVVALDDRIMGKAHDRAQARQFLESLSGKVHQVVTGVAIMDASSCETFCSASKVYFYPLSAREIDNYLDSLEWQDKAGAYAIQGLGCRFVEKIEGDYNNIVGLPVARLYRELMRF